MKIVVIDAGHGGKDPGAIGNGLREKDITLKISTEVARRLQNDYEGVRCLLTRSTDLHLELKERTNMTNKAKADLLVSIHVNAGGGAGGFESFTYNGVSDPKTSAYQNVLHTEIMAQLKKFSVIDRGQKKKNLHMVRESNMTSVLTECLFIDVAADATRLKRADVIEAFIKGHVSGVAKFLGLKAKQTQQDNTIDVYVNGAYIGKGEVENGVTKVPVRAVSQALGATVNYTKNRVDINTQ